MTTLAPDLVFRAILDCYMCADTSPIRERANLNAWLDEQSQARGFANWVVAYHEFQKKEQA